MPMCFCWLPMYCVLIENGLLLYSYMYILQSSIEYITIDVNKKNLIFCCEEQHRQQSRNFAYFNSPWEDGRASEYDALASNSFPLGRISKRKSRSFGAQYSLLCIVLIYRRRDVPNRKKASILNTNLLEARASTTSTDVQSGTRCWNEWQSNFQHWKKKNEKKKKKEQNRGSASLKFSLLGIKGNDLCIKGGTEPENEESRSTVKGFIPIG